MDKNEALEVALQYIGGHIKSVREMMELTQRQVADLAEVNIVTVKRLESGKSWPGLHQYTKIRQALGMSIKF